MSMRSEVAWALALGWLEVGRLLRLRPAGRLLESELERRSVIYTAHPRRPATWAVPHSTFHYWRGYFRDLRGRTCVVLCVKPWSCPSCHRHRGLELEVRPLEATRNLWHLYLVDACGCGCRRPGGGDLLSLRR